MKSTAHLFRPQARDALNDVNLQQALARARGGFIDKRGAAVAGFSDFEALRERGRQIRAHTIAHLDTYLEQFADQVEANGGQLHWAVDGREACDVIVEICRKASARRVIKSKSMVGEEIAINDALEGAGFEAVETDLGEYIIQLAGEPPSHIIAPAVHKTRAQITDLFAEHHHGGKSQGDRSVPDLVNEARQVLRDKFLNAEVGITGANFLAADRGSAIIVTNEGNADLSLTLPKVHIVLTSIDKLVPTLDDAATLLRLLPRSATGQELTTYTTVVNGARQAGEPDGPDEYHVVLLDNGRSRMLGGEFREMLQCIRCGACMNHCPVYSAIGGHAYGWVYPGPMGSVLTPHFIGLDRSVDLPNACTLNGRCQDVCPVKIPLPDLLRKLRMQQFNQGLLPAATRVPLRLWGKLAGMPRLYHRGAEMARAALRLAQRLGWSRPPLSGGWTRGREMPRPQQETFVNAWQRRRGRASHD